MQAMLYVYVPLWHKASSRCSVATRHTVSVALLHAMQCLSSVSTRYAVPM